MSDPASIAHKIVYEGSSDTIENQLKAYKERELDRSPPDGYCGCEITLNADADQVTFLTRWRDQASYEEVADSAPWEACMDLNETFADSYKAETFNILD